MPREIITLQVGQCGNQLGIELWKRLCSEHGIDKQGQLDPLIDPESGCDRKDIFYYQSDSGAFVPRALLFDLEPRVLQTIKVVTSPTDRVCRTRAIEIYITQKVSGFHLKEEAQEIFGHLDLRKLKNYKTICST